MKRIYIVLMIVLMLSMLAFVPYPLMAENELYQQKSRPIAQPIAIPAPVQLTAPTLLSPANGATVSGKITWTWNAVPGAACYHLQAGRGTNLDEQYNIINRSCLTDMSYTFNVTPGFVVYFPHLHWRVRARTTTDINGTYGPWSEVWRVNLKSP
jgi:hypothetical protein